MAAVDKVDDVDVVSILTDLCQLLSSDPLTVDDVRLEVAELPLVTTVEPEPGTESPAYVRLVLGESNQMTLDDLQEAFGPHKKLPRMHRRGSDKYIFYVDLAEYPYTCALIAETQMDQKEVQVVIVRRDIRLE
jgi:hypothetical protein